MFDFYTIQIQVCDAEIERVYCLTRPNWEAGEVHPLGERKRNAHSKNRPQNPEGIRKHLKRISGVDLSVVDGFGVSLAQTVIMEVGTDMSKFPSEKHFCSWLGLAPKHEISGGKVLKNKTLKTKNRAGQAFRTLAPHCVWCSAGVAAQSVKQADCVFGVMYRRLKARLGPAQATVATAHAIARAVYRMLKYKVDYETTPALAPGASVSVEEYEKKYRDQQFKYMRKKAAKLGYQLVPACLH
jgi:transposase